MTNVKHQSRNNIKSLLSNKKILVDGVSISQFDYLLQPKQVVRISKAPILQKSLLGSLKIIYEDDYLLAINKPAGLLSIGTDKEDRATAYRMVSDYIQQLDKHKRVYVVHRIDKETSGVLLFAKTDAIRKKLQDNWNEVVKLREYSAIVDGKMRQGEGTIQTWLKKLRHILCIPQPIKKKVKKPLLNIK